MTVMEPNAPAPGTGPVDDVEDVAKGVSGAGTEEQGITVAEGSSPAADPSAPAAAPQDLGGEMPPTAEELLRQINGLPGGQSWYGDVASEAGDASVAPRPIPMPLPFPLPYRAASGRYRSRPGAFQLELRVDVDGRRPLRRLSGDYYRVSGSTTSYFGSWTVDAVTARVTDTAVTVVGTARTTWQTTFTVARVTIPRTRIGRPAAAATIRWFTPSGASGATYVCAWESAAFRTVELEEDCESGVTPFASYNTATLPSGGPARTLTTAGAFGEAGIQMVDTGGANVVRAPSGHVWNNASLHNAMQRHFSRWRDVPQFRVWLLHAMRHEFGSGLRGIMFDQQGPQRQGCASFYQVMGERNARNLREQLYVNVHELGHCFNLFHSFHKDRMTPPLPNRPGSLSWMNYPRFYNPGGGAPSGEAAFWAAFPFQFDDLELAHLRHGFRDAVIMGGNAFGRGAAFEAGDEYGDPVSDTSGLQLRIAPAEPTVMLGTPVVLNISLIAERSQQIDRREQLHPKFGFVSVAVNRPGGDMLIHRPPVKYCVEPELVTSGRAEEQPVSAYIGYDGSVGHIFTEPGTYRVRASYTAPDGTVIASDVVSLRVASPRNEEDEHIADLMLGEQTGMALTLLGSDSPYLAAGTRALESVLSEHAGHPMAVYARLALGTNAARPFAAVTDDGDVRVRERDLSRADELLTEAIDASRGAAGLDDLTVYETMSYLADCHQAAEDTETARTMRQDALELARSKGAPDSVLRSLQE
ncbi:hypothetical protein [Haloechinothrix sp. LS1_15]|uniref:tetratricopeptide repeat protein n=1 Tax=Haloechinothrix sp. LS1_15 TaxID=2652248 RepID=UPI002944E9E2|nr:hypothetical protein [Haloechinothrix sp. LS1_15]MDV6011743.1 tetratricopeptide repeat protein [Haloechinothrix sp. LS1_15]